MATIQQLERALIKADAAGDEQAARAFAAEIKRMRASGGAKPKAPAPKEAGFFETIGSGFRTGLKDVMDRVPSPLNFFTELTTSPEKLAVIERGRRGLDVRAREIEKQRPLLYGTGRIGGQVVSTAPALNVLGAGIGLVGQGVSKVAPRVGKVVQETGRVIPTGGFGTKSKIARVAAGGGAGAATAAATGTDITEGAGYGAAIPVIGGILGKTFGAGYDILAGRVGKTKAAEMLRKAVGDRIDDVKAALATATADERAALTEFLESKGIKIPVLAAVEKNIRQSAASQPMREAAQGMEAELNALRTQARRGGATATEAENLVTQRRKELMQATEGQRQAGIEAMDIGRTQVLPLEGAAPGLVRAADEITATGFVPRMRGLEERSAEQLDAVFQNPEFFTLNGPAARTGAVAEGAGQRADDAIELQIALRDAARANQAQADILRAQGNQPINLGPLLGSLRGGADEARNVNSDRADILTDFADRLEARARQFGGVIDAAGFYEMRKNINQSIDRLLAGRDPAAIKKATASILGEIRPQIDAAIRAAGGDELLQSIDVVAKGLQDLEQQTVANALTRVQQRRPESFARIMAGEEPGAVRTLTGGFTGDITEALGGRLPDVQALVGPTEAIIQRGKFYIPDELPMAADYRKGVAAEAADIMQAGLPLGVRATSRLMEAKLPGGGRAGAVLEGRYGDYMQNKVLNELAPMLASPQNAMANMGVVPTSEALSNYIQGLPAPARNAFARAILSGSLYGAQPSYGQ